MPFKWIKTVYDRTRTLAENLVGYYSSREVAHISADWVAAQTNELERLRAANVQAQALPVGSQAPDFKLPDPTGNLVHLAELLKVGPVVLNFYRGNWCPYCNLQIRAMQSVLASFEEYPAKLVAISPQTTTQNLAWQRDAEVTYHVLSDPGVRVGEAYGVAYTLAEEFRRAFSHLGIDLAAHNGAEGATRLVNPATFLIDQAGVVRWVYTDPADRAEPAIILNELKKLAHERNTLAQ